MRYYLLISLILIVTVVPVYSQCEAYEFNNKVIADTSFLVRHKHFVGYIFPENYHGGVLDKEKETFTLSIKQVKKIEEILLQQYNEVHKNDPRVSPEYKRKKNIKAYLRKFDRQYLGFVNKDGDKAALIILARIRRKHKRYFPCFDLVMTIGFGEVYEKNQKHFIVDLKKEKLLLP